MPLPHPYILTTTTFSVSCFLVKELIPQKTSISVFITCSRKRRFGHERRVVVRNLPFSLFVHVDKTVSSLHRITRGMHGEFVNTGILTPVVANAHVGFQNFPLGFVEQERIKVILDASVVSARSI